jgi:hypothetical protein
MSHLGRIRALLGPGGRSGTAARRRRGLSPGVLGCGDFRLEDRTLLATNLPLSTSSWVAIGPTPLGTSPASANSGRITGIAASPTDANTLYIAAAGGGVWKTTNAGTNPPTWTPLTDAQQTLSMGAVAVAPSNGNVLYAGTGEANNSADSNYGTGIMHSTDGGATWAFQTSGIPFGLTTAKIAVDPTSPNIAYAAMGNVGGNQAFINGSGLYKTTDGGVTWTNLTDSIAPFDNFSEPSDVVIDPTTPSTLYLAIGAYYGAGPNGVYKSTNSGASWTLLTGVPSGSASDGRISLAISKSNPQDLYVVIAGPTNTTSGQLVFFGSTTNGGASWTNLTAAATALGNPFDGQGWYDQYLAVDPTNPSIVYIAGAATGNALERSTNGGTSFTSIISGGSSPHVDHHATAFDASGRFLDGDDGGIYRLDNTAPTTWTDLNGNLDTIQFVGGGVNPFNPDQALGGSQDNGTERFNNNAAWTTTDGGDGGQVLYGKQTNNLAYRVSPIGSFGTSAYFRKSTNGGQSWTSATNGITGLSGTNFYPTIALDPTNDQRVFIGGSSIASTTNGAASWSTYASPGANGFNPSGSTVDAIAVAPTNTSVVYAATGGYFASSSQVFVTTNNGGTWSNISIPGAGRVNEIDVDPTNSAIAYAVISTFNGGRVFRTTNTGASWTNISDSLPNLPGWSLKIDPTNTSTLYLGSDNGVYKTTNTGGSWSRLGTGFPNAQVFYLDLAPNENILAAFTHGRGAFELLTQATLPTNVTSTIADGTYGSGTTIPITVTFSSVVKVTGTPQLLLSDGAVANYASGSGTTTLTFNYVVGAGDTTGGAKLDYASTTALTLNGGTILDPSNSPATLTLPAPGAAGSLGANKSIIIQTAVAPTVTGVTSTLANGTYGVGTVVPITVTFTAPVNVTGTPILALNSGGTASYSSGSGTSTLTFTYTVAAGQNSPKLDYTATTALSLNGGTIKDGSNNNANLIMPAPGSAGSLSGSKSIAIDTVAPAVTSVGATTADGTYGVGATITITVGWSKPVVVTGTPQLALNSGGTASYSSGSGTSSLTFTYIVAAGQNSPHLDYTSTGALSLNGGTISDTVTNSNAANLTLPAPGAAGSLGANKSIQIDTTAPAVTSVGATTADGTYGVGSVITITVGWSKPVVVTGTPQLALNSGGTASYSSGSGTSSLTFTYTVAAGQNSPKLDYTATTALSLNGGSISDTVTNPNAANLALPAPGAAGSLGANKSIVIDTTVPVVLSYSVLFGSQSYNLIGSARFDLPWQITGIKVVFSEPIAAGDVHSLTGLTTTAFAGLGTNTLTWTISPVMLGSFSTTLLGTGADALKDAAGNALAGGSGFAQAFRVLLGDFNGDGAVNSADMVNVQAAAAQPYNIFADINGDGVVDVNDVQAVRRRIGTHL